MIIAKDMHMDSKYLSRSHQRNIEPNYKTHLKSY